MTRPALADLRAPTSPAPANRDADLSGQLARFLRSGERTALRVLRDADLANDAVQDALSTAWRKLDTLRNSAAAEAWFARIVLRNCLRLKRRAERETSALELDPACARPDAAELLLRAEIQRRFEAALAGLGDVDRAIARLRFLEERPLAEIADAVERTTDGVKNRLRVLRPYFQRALADYGPALHATGAFKRAHIDPMRGPVAFAA